MTTPWWIVVAGGVAAEMLAIVYGANMPVNCWGPCVGARAISYKKALVLGLIGQAFGLLVFGPEVHSAYGTFLDHRERLYSHPMQTMYALTWSLIIPLIWQLVALQQKVVMPMYLATVAGTVGATIVFPGVEALNFGHFRSVGQIDGLAAVLLMWLLAPPATMLITAWGFLMMRGSIFRGEDCFHQMLWYLPITAAWTVIICGVMLSYGIDLPNDLPPPTPQAAGIVLTAAGSVASIMMTLGVKHAARYLSMRVRPPDVINRMSLLGLDQATVKEIAAIDVFLDVKSVLQRVHDHCFELDLMGLVTSSDALLSIHSSAEEFSAIAEQSYIPFQVLYCFLLSTAWGAQNGHLTFPVFQTIREIYASDSVPETVTMGWWMHGASITGMTVGTLLLGKRLTPVTGVGLAKLSPFRSMVAIGFVLEVVALLGIIDTKGAATTYCVVASVVAVGLVEGSSHVNWKLLCTTLLWWAMGFFITIVITALCVAQGLYSPSMFEAQS